MYFINIYGILSETLATKPTQKETLLPNQSVTFYKQYLALNNQTFFDFLMNFYDNLIINSRILPNLVTSKAWTALSGRFDQVLNKFISR